MTILIYPILLCGGSGTRLWPLSRKSHPKQFVKLLGEESLFQASARRLSGDGYAAPAIITTAQAVTGLQGAHDAVQEGSYNFDYLAFQEKLGRFGRDERHVQHAKPAREQATIQSKKPLAESNTVPAI